MPDRGGKKGWVAATHLLCTGSSFNELFDASQAANLAAYSWMDSDFSCQSDDTLLNGKGHNWVPRYLYESDEEEYLPWRLPEPPPKQTQRFTCEAQIPVKDGSDNDMSGREACGHQNGPRNRLEYKIPVCSRCGNMPQKSYVYRVQEVDRRMLSLLQTCDTSQTDLEQLLNRQKRFQGDPTLGIHISDEEYSVARDKFLARKSGAAAPSPRLWDHHQLADPLESASEHAQVTAETRARAALQSLDFPLAYEAYQKDKAPWSRSLEVDCTDGGKGDSEGGSEETARQEEFWAQKGKMSNSLEHYIDRCMRKRRTKRDRASHEDTNEAAGAVKGGVHVLPDRRKKRKLHAPENKPVAKKRFAALWNAEVKIAVEAKYQPLRAGTISELLKPWIHRRRHADRNFRCYLDSEKTAEVRQRQLIRLTAWHWHNAACFSHHQLNGLRIPDGSSSNNNPSFDESEEVPHQHVVPKDSRGSEESGASQLLSSSTKSAFQRVHAPQAIQASLPSDRQEESGFVARPSPFKDAAPSGSREEQDKEIRMWSDLHKLLPRGAVAALETARNLGYPQHVIQSTMARILQMKENWEEQQQP